MNKITQAQYEEMRDASSTEELVELLAEYAGIETRPYTAYQYFVDGGTFVGDSDNYTLIEVLENAGIEVDRQ